MTRILVQRGSNKGDRAGPSSSGPSQPASGTSEVEIVEEVQEKDLSEEFSGIGSGDDSRVVQRDDLSGLGEKDDDDVIDKEKAGEDFVRDSTQRSGGLRTVEEERQTGTGMGCSYPPPPPVPPPKPFSGNVNPRRFSSGSSNAARSGSSRRPTAWPVVPTRTSPTGSRPTSPRSHCENEGYNSADEQSPRFGSSYSDAEREHQFEIDLRRTTGLEVKRMLEDGNCLFRAVADQVYGDIELYDLVRQMCIDYMERERDHFSQFITEGFISYCKRKRRDKVYGNNMEIQAFCEMYNRPIHIYSYSTEPINIFQGSYNTDTPPIRLSFHHGNHYNSLVDPRRVTVGAGLGFSSLRGSNVDKDQVSAAIKAQQEQQIDNALLAEGRFYSDLELTEKEMERMVMEASRAEYLADDKFKQLGRRESSTSAAGAEPSSSGARPSGSKTNAEGGKEHGLPTTVLSNSMQMVLAMGFSYLQAIEAHSIFGDDVDSMVCYLLETSSSNRRKGKACEQT
ncbi:OVARIAN TUMOR DOMAIN-containing deubiquitinating enzyme 6 [Apium graveolens]|uniref:OVARIAN TUMOR DOMAIN-containing deubiquitinating enzyme 6 n=1 Tax=Apium graveolens TaxID=4045 RepID=UPI003D7B6F9D